MTGKLLLDLAIILLVAYGMGRLFAHVRQPPVIGHIVGGILLGPTLLGVLPENPSATLFPPAAVAQLRVIGQLGLSVFMFTVGWDLDIARVRRHAHTAGVISGASITLPFTLGLALATALYPAHHGPDPRVGYWAFALFIAASLSITAFPVLARILTETGLANTLQGLTSLAAAAVDDVVGWTTVAIILAFVASGGVWDYSRVLLETVVFACAMLWLVRPAMRCMIRWPASVALGPKGTVSLILAGIFASSYATEAIGVHAVFGAFLFGAVMPRRKGIPALSELRHALRPVIVVLLPVYFVVSGLAVNLTKLHSADLGYLVLILLTAVVGKFGGAFAAARIEGFRSHDAAAVGILMNARGLIEIVLLTIGLEKGIIDQQVFSLLVLMALITTLVAPPALRLLQRQPPADSGTPTPCARSSGRAARLS